MKAYLIDEIPPEEIDKLKDYFGDRFTASRMGQIFWARMPDHVLTEVQALHTACRPHVFAVEAGSDWIRFEFLVRSLNSMHCTCPGYCTYAQRDYVLKLADGILEKLNIHT